MKWTLILLLIPGILFAPNESVNLEFKESIIIEKKLNTLAYFNKKDMVNKIAAVIRKNESSGNYMAIGMTGEYGAYQFMPSTWAVLSNKYFNREVKQTPRNQDIIAKKRISELLNEGYSIDQIASIWNSGSHIYDGKIGVNYMGVKYNVPRYVEKFLNEFNKTI